MRFSQPKVVVAYADSTGHEPYTEWVNTIRDEIDQERIRGRVRRLMDGNYGDCESVGEGVYELRLFFGSGYRVYFGERKNQLVILLCGGNKKNQQRDIKQAKSYWKEYLRHEKKL